MFLAEFVSNRAELSGTKTYHDYAQFLGKLSHKVGVAAQLCKNHTVAFLTDRLMNVVTKDLPKAKNYQDINSFCIEWDVDVNIIKRIPFASVPIGDGVGGSEVIMAFTERYYDRNDVFSVDKTRQQFIVKEKPVRKADNYWEYVVKIQDAEYDIPVDFSGCQVGLTTHLITNIAPIEFSREGYTKYQSNMEAHRTYMSMHRNDIDASALYLSNEDQFVKISKEGADGHKLFKMTKAQRTLQENFIQARENKLLWAKTNVDKNGKPKDFDKETGIPMISGDGIIPQIERFGQIIAFDTLTRAHFSEALDYLSQKGDSPIGNAYSCICNTKLWNQVGNLLSNYLKDWNSSATLMWSKEDGERNMDAYKVGATFKTYEVNGNRITFMVDRALDLEYNEDAFGFILDLTPDLANGKPAIEMFTYKGCDMKYSTVEGVGGLTGLEEGKASTPVMGSKMIYWGWGQAVVYAPYRSVIFRAHPKTVI